jgi:hypothetical protein
MASNSLYVPALLPIYDLPLHVTEYHHRIYWYIRYIIIPEVMRECRMVCSGMLRRGALVRSDISEELSAKWYFFAACVGSYFPRVLYLDTDS